MRKSLNNKVISFCIPCYNSAEYMNRCIKSLLAQNTEDNDIEIIIVDDGSTKDNTLEIANQWKDKYPDVFSVVHQENGGHGSAVNTGLRVAKGLYYKVVDSDDWLDVEETKPIINYLREQARREKGAPTDLVMANYVYKNCITGRTKVISYSNCMPTNREFTWDELGDTKAEQNIIMHTCIFRTELLRDIDLTLPKHTYYVDHVFVYSSFPSAKTLYYFDKNMYMYFIGRDDQSVNEKVMAKLIGDQITVSKIMIDSINYDELKKNPQLCKYMISHLGISICICSVFLRKSGSAEDKERLAELWNYLRNKNEELYKLVRGTNTCRFTNIPGHIGRFIAVTSYKVCQKVYGFN